MLRKIAPLGWRLIALLSLLVTSSAVVRSQSQNQYDKGTPPQHTAGVSTLGSYISTEVGTVNVSNGALNIKLPLGNVGGRGFWTPLTLNYSSKLWSSSIDTDTDRSGSTQPVAYADYDRGNDSVDLFSRVGAGWTVGAAPMLSRKIVRISRITSGPQSGCYRYTLAKLTLILPDRGEVEFRDDAYDGAPLSSDCSGYVAASRGVRWHATDGSGMIFINDVDNGVALWPSYNTSGVVITADGTRYRFTGSRCISITDRNGNQITISYVGNEVDYTDPLGRLTKIQKNVADPQNPSVTLALLVTLPGYQGQSHYYKLKSGPMSQHYRSGINPSLPVITGDWDPVGWGYHWPGTPTKLFSQSYGLYAQEIDILNVLYELVLPDTRSLLFSYNQFGEVAEVQLPTGGKIQYDYLMWIASLPSGNSPDFETGTGGGTGIRTDVKTVDRGVSEKRTYPDGTTLEGKWTYSYGPQLLNGVSRPCSEVKSTSGAGTLMLDERHFFLDAGRYEESYITSGNHDGTFYTLWSTGVESRSETLNAAGSVLSANEQDWTQRSAVVWSSYPQEQPANDNRVSETRRYLDTGSFAKTDTFYDNVNYPRANNVSEVKEYDFDQTLKRRTTTTYIVTNNGYNYQTDDSIHLLRLPLVQTVYDGAGPQMAQTVNEYDVYASDGNRAPLTDYYPVSQHDPSYGVAKTTRGNVTRSDQWVNTTSSFIYSYPRYDTLGNMVSAKDPNGNVSTISFADDFGDGSNPGSHTNNPVTPTYALPTLITSPPPLPGQPAHTASSQYDFSTGLLTGFRDRNNIVTQTLYNDPFNRPTFVKTAYLVSGVENHVKMYYAPATTPYGITLAKNDVLTAKDQNTLDDANLRSWTVTDGFGRTKETWSRDPQGDVKVITNYDGLGRASQSSNPFRPSLGESAVYTTSAFDFAGRVISITTPDSAVVSTSYSGNTVTVTDQMLKKRKSVTDALGRLKEVYEDPTSLNYLTSYSYDALDDLTIVLQGSQTRTFLYNSLKRLTSATNPESGTISYQYDNNGNLTQKTDARAVVTTYAYDALNRNKSVSYTNDPAGTPTTNRYYDGWRDGLFTNIPSVKGRLWQSETTGSTGSRTTLNSFDALGRPLSQSQQFYAGGAWGQSYTTQRGYNLASGVILQTYPSNHTVSYSYGNDGRATSFSGYLGDGVNRTYSTGIIYSPFGGMSKEQFGTDILLFNKLWYNVRGQLSEIRESTTYNNPMDLSYNRGAIINHYSNLCWGMCSGGYSMTDNNGNVKKQEHIVPDNEQASSAQSFLQWYDYDDLNRLKSVHEGRFIVGNGNSSQDIYQFYNAYDRYGNRTIDATQTSAGINAKQFTVITANNRLGVPSGQTGTMSYDPAGNLITDTYTGAGARTYDGENRMVTAWGGNNQQQIYTYNADGQRVRRKVDGVETWQVYGMDGELSAEYGANAAVTSPQKEYGYRNGQLLITAGNGGQTTQNVAWTNAVGVSVSSNNLTKSSSDGWNAGASSTQSILSGDGYVEFAAPVVGSLANVMCGLSNGDANQNYTDIDFGLYPWIDGNLYVYEGGIGRGAVGSYTAGNTLRVAVEGGVVKYRRNGQLLYTSTVAPIYPLLVDTTLYPNGSTISNAVISGANIGGSIQWLVADQLGTPRMIFDKSGSLANTKRHDYLPFGEELFATVNGRTTTQGYTGDTVRQKFTLKERDNETGLDYFLARYYASTQGRFTSPDEFKGGPNELFVLGSGVQQKQALPYAEITQPQSLNKYSYVYNNPCRFIDPDGHCGTPSGLKPGQVGICVASYIKTKWFMGFGRGDGRDTNGQGGTSRVEVRVAVDVSKGTVTKTDEAMGTSGILLKGAGKQASGESRVSEPNKDKQGNVYFQINQHGDSAMNVWNSIGTIDNHLNMVVTPGNKVGITPDSTAKQFPSLEVYKYTMDAKGNVTTTVVLAQTETNRSALKQPENPIKTDPQ